MAPLPDLDHTGSPSKCVPCRDVREWIRSRRRTRDWCPGGDLDMEAGDGDPEAAFMLPKRRTYYYSIFAVRLAIMVMFTILIGLLTILTWHFTTVYTTRSIKSLAFSLRTELLQRPISRMWNLLNVTLDTTLTQVNLSEYVIGQYASPVVGQQQDQMLDVMRNITWAIFTSRQAVDAVSVVYRNGMLQGFERDSTTGQAYYTYSLQQNASVYGSANETQDWDSGLSTADNLTWYRHKVDQRTGGWIGPPSLAVPYSLTQAFGGAPHVGDGDVLWHVTVHRSDDTPFLSSASPVRHPRTGEVVAIAGVTQTLRGITAFLQELVQRNSGAMYLTNEEGWLLASSTSVPLVKNTSSGPSLIRAVESDDPIIKAGAAWLRDNYGTSIGALQDVHAEDVLLGGQKHYVDTFVLNLTKLPLVGVIFTPRSYVLGTVDRRGHATLAILISVSVCILVVGCVFTLIFTSGVSTEMKLRAQLIDQLNARRRAEASSTLKSQFLANMSHELRTPMAAIIGLLDILLSDEYLSLEQVAMVSQIRHCSTALLRLLNNILDLSKVESGKLVLEEADFDLRRELEGLVDMFSVQCDQDIDFVLDLDDDIPRLLRGDSARTVQIFANLLANSIKFTPSGHVLLRGWCELGPGGDKSGRLCSVDIDNPRPPKSVNSDSSLHRGDSLYLWFEIEDTGCGIDPSKWESVFESFVQADPSTTRNYGGTGLGLCIVRSLVKKMGGEIKIVKKDGPGTMFRMYVVYNRTSERYTPRTFKDYCASTMSSEMLQETKLLLSMQGQKGRATMARWLRQKGIHVSGASSWESSMAELEGMLGVGEDGLQGKGGNLDVSSADCVGTKDMSRELQTAHHLASQVRDVHFSGTEQPPAKPKALAIMDVSMVPKMSDLEMLDRFRKQGVIVAWLLKHDTPSSVKKELRKLGFTNMVNKPVYKSKLLQLLRVMVGCVRDADVGKLKLDLGRTDDSTSDGEVKDGISRLAKLSQGAAYHLSPLNAQLQSKRSPAELLRSQSCRGMERILEDDQNEGDSSVLNRQRRWSEQFPAHRVTSYSEDGQVGASKPGHEEPRFERGSSALDSQLPKGCPSASGLEGMGLVASVEQCLLTPKQQGVPGISETVPILDKGERAGYANVEVGRGLSQENTNLPFAPGHKLGGAATNEKEGQNAQDLFTLGAPRAPQHVVPLQTVKNPASRIGPHDALKGIRILLAEDNPVLQRVATIMLEKMGAKVVAVGDGLEAVNALAMATEPERGLSRDQCSPQDDVQEKKQLEVDANFYDLILMDCQMPKMDGYQATRIIRENEGRTGSHIPIVALTAHAMSSDEAKCLDVGMDAYLTKPIDCKLMVSTIVSLTRNQRRKDTPGDDNLL